ncbi:hypothetical protein IG631_12020 [Alternaria alternata]|nr:hypothetical protein IG631_12020 [Alternaria alternata]
MQHDMQRYSRTNKCLPSYPGTQSSKAKARGYMQKTLRELYTLSCSPVFAERGSMLMAGRRVGWTNSLALIALCACISGDICRSSRPVSSSLEREPT